MSRTLSRHLDEQRTACAGAPGRRPARRRGRSRRRCERAAPAARSPRGGSSPRQYVPGPSPSRSRIWERSRAIGANRKQASAMTSPTTSIRPVTPSPRRNRGGALVRRQDQLGQAVDRDPVPLLGHREVAATEPGLDVRDRCLARRLRTRERRVRVAVDEHPSPGAPPRRRSGSPAPWPLRRPSAGRAGTQARAGRAPRRRPRTSPRPSAALCAGTNLVEPRGTQRDGHRARLMNCGRLPTTDRTLTRT